jgi:hypothetical protein
VSADKYRVATKLPVTSSGIDSVRSSSESLAVLPPRLLQPVVGGLSGADLIGGALQGLALLAENCPFPGASAVAAVLGKCYEIFKSAVTRQVWLVDFMVSGGCRLC